MKVKISLKFLEVLKEYWKYSKRVFTLFWQENPGMMAGFIIIGALISAISFINPAILALIINKIQSSGGDFSAVAPLIIPLLILYIVPYFLYPLNDYYDTLIRYFIGSVMELKMMAKWVTVDMALREDPSLNNLFYNVRTHGLNRLYQFTFRNIYVLSHLLQVSIASAVFIRYDWKIFVGYLIFFIPELIVDVKFAHSVWGIWSSEAPYRRQWSVLWDLLLWNQNVKEIKLYRISNTLLGRMKGYLDRFFSERRKIEKKKLVAYLATMTLSQGYSVFIFLVLIMATMRGEMQIGTFTFYVSTLSILKNALALLVGDISKQYQDLLFIKDLFKFFDLPKVIVEKTDAVKIEAKAPVIEFKNVTFHYPNSKENIFTGLDLMFRTGEKIAIVGVNGAGKSTLIKLLLRFYDVNEGEILIDGVNIKDIDLDSYYEQVGVLFQDYINYNFLVKEAISSSTEKIQVKMDEVESAARRSGASEFIEHYEHGYDTQLGKEFDEGIDPSVGQWQKLAMARTFYKNPKVYILDEPTASIDAEAEEKIFESLEELPENITVVLISHRFSTVRRADKIVVLEHGKILEQGTHEELMANQSRYYDLFTKQAKGYQ